MRFRLLVLAIAALAFAPQRSSAQAEPSASSSIPAFTQAQQRAITPTEALQRLKDGNARFVSGTPLARDLRAQVRATAGAQFPFATVLGCMDSRVPPESIFDQGIGDIFSSRVAGNFVDPALLGGLEFASKVTGAKLIVVLGHSNCGAIMGACDDVKLGNLTQTLSHLRPAVAAVTDVPGPRSSKNAAFVTAVTEMNVKLTLEAIRKQSPILDEMISKGELGLVGGMYDVATGVVTFRE